ncbi:MAG: alcohol dehydrogenase catalytic domain-containing protein [Clostridia bacterium]|nr:alcohol dehydrogenase catalytic domain-containing protein [Clostridia bacterium]
MKAVFLEAPGSIGIRDMAEPIYEAGMALIKVRAAGICGSDIAAYRGTNPLVTYPRIIGHEIAGEIIRIGDNPKGLKEGGRVILDPYLYCGKCYPCSLGRTNCCETLRVIGVHVDGGMRGYMLYPQNMLIPVPDGIEWEHIPLAEPLTIALHAIHRTRLKAGEHVVINGAGAIGVLTAMCAKAYGAIPIITDLVEERLEFAKENGIPFAINPLANDPMKIISDITNGRMAEVVVEASGAGGAIRAALDMVSYAGRIALTGWPREETSLPTGMITKKEIDIYGSRTSAGEFEEALMLLSSGKVDAPAILSKVISMDGIPAIVAEQSAHPERYLKVNALI